MKRYEFLKQAADLTVRVYGGSLKELFTSAALAMFSVLVAKKANRQKALLKEVTIVKKEEAIEDLLKSWLDELLFYFSSEQLILHRIKSLDIEESALESKVLLEVFDDAYFEPKGKIKTVASHGLKVELIRNRWQAHIVFEV